MSLRRSFAIFMTVLTIVALAAVVALVLLPKYIHREAVDLESDLHSVRLAVEIEVDLLSHARTKDATQRRNLEADWQRKLADASSRVTAADESAVLARALHSIDAYVRNLQVGTEREKDLDDALDSLQEFASVNVRQAEA